MQCVALEEVDLNFQIPWNVKEIYNILSNCQSVINGLYFEQLW